MKTTINVTIDERILIRVQAYAASKNTSISELVEEYFKIIHCRHNRKTIIDLVEKLTAPEIDVSGDLKLYNICSKLSRIFGANSVLRQIFGIFWSNLDLQPTSVFRPEKHLPAVT